MKFCIIMFALLIASLIGVGYCAFECSISHNPDIALKAQELGVVLKRIYMDDIVKGYVVADRRVIWSKYLVVRDVDGVCSDLLPIEDNTRYDRRR